ncbi:MAG: DUF1343 domain-containing protein [Candidatus Riflebacteria bacterium]|nr:DUF1343 domain-containing protein [Candidatus Riflebacteria bacterium]
MKKIFLIKTSVIILLLIILVYTPSFAAVKAGIDVLATQHPTMVKGKKLAVMTSKAALDSNLCHTVDRLAKAAEIKIIITGDRFFRESIPGNQGEEGSFDALTSAKVVEILDPLQKPSQDLFKDVDSIVIDFQDIGIRYYKYVTLMAQILDVAREIKLPVILLDRPNPINGKTISGPVLEVALRSRFGVYPIPLIYGMTIAELALYFNKVFGLGANLTVIGMEGYKRKMNYVDTGLHWVPPSDFIPEPTTPLYYAATGFIGEIGVFSTGVGTNRPFHYILSPWIDGEILTERLESYNLPGVRFIPVQEKPYYGLYSGQVTNGIELVITNAECFDPFLTGTAILKSLYELYPDRIPLQNQAAAEAIDCLAGDSSIREMIISNQPLMQIYSSIQQKLTVFMQRRNEFLIYSD